MVAFSSSTSPWLQESLLRASVGLVLGDRTSVASARAVIERDLSR